MATESKGRFEMIWDCPGCGTERLLAVSQRFCPNCGAPQDPTKRYYPPEGEQVAVANPYEGVDVQCPACDTPNGAKSTFCAGCGSPLDGAKAVATRAEQAAKGGFAEDSASNAAKEREEARKKEQQAAIGRHAEASGHAPPKSGGGLKILLVLLFGGVGVALCAGVALLLFWKQDAALAVTGHAWERTVAVETFSQVKERAWRESLPAGAYDVACRQEEKEKKQVPDGEDCTDKRQDKGDGSFEIVRECKPKYRSEPVYADRCDYTVDAWKVTRTERAGASGLTPAPSWPVVTLARTGNTLGAEREGARKETYTVTLTDTASNAAHTCDFPEEKWRAIADGSRWTSQVGVLSGSLDCGALAAQ